MLQERRNDPRRAVSNGPCRTPSAQCVRAIGVRIDLDRTLRPLLETEDPRMVVWGRADCAAGAYGHFHPDESKAVIGGFVVVGADADLAVDAGCRRLKAVDDVKSRA